MKPIALGLAIAALVLALARKSSAGDPPPPLNAAKWFNSPSLSFADLKGKAVWVQCFRTW